MRPLPPELEQQIDECRLWMFEGDQKRVAKISGKLEPYVSKVLNKKIGVNKQVLDAAIKVMNENKVRFEIPTKMEVA